MIVFTTLPTADAPRFVRTLVDERLVACGNILGQARSIYRWEGEVRDEAEAVALLETTEDQLEIALHRMETLHPYTCPKLIVLDPHGVNEAYSAWVQSEMNLGR